MAREKGMGNLQREKSGRWTLRVGIDGKRFSRSTRTTDREKAERMLQRFLAPLGLGERRVPLGEVWREYLKSPNRNDLAPSTLHSKRNIWFHFANWMERDHPEIGALAAVTPDAIAEYLADIRVSVCASTYNSRVCVLREIFRVLAERAGVVDDPWACVRLRSEDPHTRREFTVEELGRVLSAARKAGEEWGRLFMIGLYTGLRLGDCCTLEWRSVNLERGIIQLIPRKTRRHAHGHPVTIPLHAELAAMLARQSPVSPYVLPQLAEWYLKGRWQIQHQLKAIFRQARVTMSVRVEGRRRKVPEATFHSLRHTFVSLAANAGVPLPVVQSIVGHCSTAMTRHYYHESEADLRRAVAAIPAFEVHGSILQVQGGRE